MHAHFVLNANRRKCKKILYLVCATFRNRPFFNVILRELQSRSTTTKILSFLCSGYMVTKVFFSPMVSISDTTLQFSLYFCPGFKRRKMWNFCLVICVLLQSVIAQNEVNTFNDNNDDEELKTNLISASKHQMSIRSAEGDLK